MPHYHGGTEEVKGVDLGFKNVTIQVKSKTSPAESQRRREIVKRGELKFY